MTHGFDSFTHPAYPGLTFGLRTEPDLGAGPPWENSEGHGPVRRASTRGYHGVVKNAGEILLDDDGTHLYDRAEAQRMALRDGWGLRPDAFAALARKLGRAPTKREAAAAAVDDDIRFLAGWLRDDWRYVGVRVVLLDDEGEPVEDSEASLWCVDDSDPAYIGEVAAELAAECARFAVPFPL